MKNLCLLLLSILLTFTSISDIAQASDGTTDRSLNIESNDLNSTIQEYAQLGEFYESYLFLNQKGQYEVNYKKIQDDNLTVDHINEIKEYTGTKNLMSENGQPSLERAKRIMFHGNYCGKGNNGGKPKDKLDAACKRHDECYARYGWGKCKCDKPFIKAAHSIAQNKKYSKKYRKKAARAAILFAVAYNRCR